jgi:hypothetical protein
MVLRRFGLIIIVFLLGGSRARQVWCLRKSDADGPVVEQSSFQTCVLFSSTTSSMSPFATTPVASAEDFESTISTKYLCVRARNVHVRSAPVHVVALTAARMIAMAPGMAQQ